MDYKNVTKINHSHLPVVLKYKIDLGEVIYSDFVID